MIVTAGLSPAWQQILVFESLARGDVNRARQALQTASGKVVNAARAVAQLGGDGVALTVVGGPLGDAITQSLAADGIRAEVVRTESPSRICTTLIDGGTPERRASITELVENSRPLCDQDYESFRALFRRHAARASVVVLMGSLPGGARSSYFRELVEGLEASIVADIRGADLLELLPLRPRLVKPNRAELAATLGRRVDSDTDLRDAMRRLNELGAGWVVVTQGPDRVWASGDGELHGFRPPRVEVVNTIGCGDTMAGGIAVALDAGRPVLEAIRSGVACAVESARSLVPGDFDMERALERAAEIEHERIVG